MASADGPVAVHILQAGLGPRVFLMAHRRLHLGSANASILDPSVTQCSTVWRRACVFIKHYPKSLGYTVRPQAGRYRFLFQGVLWIVPEAEASSHTTFGYLGRDFTEDIL